MTRKDWCPDLRFSALERRPDGIALMGGPGHFTQKGTMEAWVVLDSAGEVHIMGNLEFQKEYEEVK